MTGHKVAEQWSGTTVDFLFSFGAAFGSVARVVGAEESGAQIEKATPATRGRLISRGSHLFLSSD